MIIINILKSIFGKTNFVSKYNLTNKSLRNIQEKLIYKNTLTNDELICIDYLQTRFIKKPKNEKQNLHNQKEARTIGVNLDLVLSILNL